MVLSTPSPEKAILASCNMRQNFERDLFPNGNPLIEKQLGGFTRLQTTLEKVLGETHPDCVVSTYPVYAHILKKIYGDNERPFRFITVVTDSSPSTPPGIVRPAIFSAWPTTRRRRF